MNSLLATLIELRILIITLFVSGAVHLTLIGSGWLDSQQPVRLGGQALKVTVTASQTDNDSGDNDSADTALDDTAPPVAAATTTKQTDKPLARPAAKQPDILSGSLRDRAAPISAGTSESAPDTSSTASAELKPVTEDVAEIRTRKAMAQAETPVAPAAAESQPEPVSLQKAPLYQSHPEFLIPPESPRYPRLARKRGLEGQVVLRVEIGRDGLVEGLQIERSSGSDLLDQAARNAVQRWQFVPARQNGSTVASFVRVPVDFVLEKH